MSLDAIIGHENIKKQINNSIKNNRFSHGSIIVGEDGIGKSLIAREIAVRLIGKTIVREYGDIIQYRVKNNKKSIGIDEIRSLIEEINKKPIEGDTKVVIIYNSHLITEVAQNAFLKTIEEPPKGVFIILLCENINKLLDTVKSRCEVYKLNKLNVEEIKNFVINKREFNLDESKLNSAIAFSDGIPGRAEKFIEDKLMKEIRDISLDIIVNLNKLDRYNYIYKYENLLLKYKNDFDELFTCILSYVRDALVYKETGRKELLLNIDKLSIIRDISEKFSFIKLSKIIDIVNSAKNKSNTNVNFTLVCDSMLIKMQEV